MKLLCELNDQMILGQDGLSDKPPRWAARLPLATILHP